MNITFNNTAMLFDMNSVITKTGKAKRSFTKHKFRKEFLVFSDEMKQEGYYAPTFQKTVDRFE